MRRRCLGRNHTRQCRPGRTIVHPVVRELTKELVGRRCQSRNDAQLGAALADAISLVNAALASVLAIFHGAAFATVLAGHFTLRPCLVC